MTRVVSDRRGAMRAVHSLFFGGVWLSCFGWLMATGVLRAAEKNDSSKNDPSPGELSKELSSSAVSDADVIAFINEQIHKGWKDAEVSPSPEASDNEWCRRVYLDILGRIPSVSEVQSFLKEKSKNRKAELVDRLLDSDEYVEEYARNWTTIWT
ncbi:MAG TPA: DUF1549 domain-containing protein, partial [Pirellulales bacterium]